MLFEIKAFHENEGIVDLTIEAGNEEEASAAMLAQGYAIISSKQKQNPLNFSRYRFPLKLFSQELPSLLDAGIPLFEAIETLSSKELNGQSKRIYADLLKKLSEGQSFSVALKKNPGHFPSLFAALVHASEKTGDLKHALSRYITYQNQIDSIRKKVISASIYPVLLLLTGALVIVFLMTYVVPKFSKVYQDAGKSLPFLSTLLMKWGQFFENHSTEILVAVIALALALAAALRRAGVRSWFRKSLRHIPAVGQRIQLYQFANLYRTVGMLLKGGIPLLSALDMTSGLLGPGLQSSLGGARELIWEGKPVSDSMQKSGLTTEVAVRMLRAGEHSGNLGDMMERIANFYDEESSRWIDWFTHLLEPSIMIFIGIVIGTIVLLMYMPIFDLADSVQ